MTDFSRVYLLKNDRWQVYTKIVTFSSFYCKRPQKDNILKFNQYIKSDKTPCIIYADLTSFIKK